MTDAERAKRYRDRKRGGPPRQVAECGTRSAAARHRRRGEPLDEACKQAEREYQRQIRSRRPPILTGLPVPSVRPACERSAHRGEHDIARDVDPACVNGSPHAQIPTPGIVFAGISTSGVV